MTVLELELANYHKNAELSYTEYRKAYDKMKDIQTQRQMNQSIGGGIAAAGAAVGAASFNPISMAVGAAISGLASLAVGIADGVLAYQENQQRKIVKRTEDAFNREVDKYNRRITDIKTSNNRGGYLQDRYLGGTRVFN